MHVTAPPTAFESGNHSKSSCILELSTKILRNIELPRLYVKKRTTT